MSESAIINIGDRFGRLTIIGESRKLSNPKNGSKPVYKPYFVCRCDCGNIKEVTKSNLKNRHAVSCGCFQTEHRKLPRPNTVKTGLSRDRIYNNYMHMKARCNNPTHPNYLNYGGRGIKVCDRWMESFENFYADMGERPSDDHSLDRIDNNGNYEPENCRWATRSEQGNNRRGNVFLALNGERMTVMQWSKRLGISVATIHRRLRDGYSAQQCLMSRAEFRKSKHAI